MTDDPASLSKLHDISIPAEVSWWPLAPGWMVLISALILALIYYLFRHIQNWRRNAYRREAISLLKATQSSAEVSELLRRTALAIEKRETIASLQGESWVEWLTQHAPTGPSEPVRSSLCQGLYDPASPTADLSDLRQFAESWIRHHRSPC